MKGDNGKTGVVEKRREDIENGGKDGRKKDYLSFTSSFKVLLGSLNLCVRA